MHRSLDHLLPLCAGLPVPLPTALGFPTGSMSDTGQTPLSYCRLQRHHRRVPCALDRSYSLETSNGLEGPALGRLLVWSENMVKKILHMGFQELTTRNSVLFPAAAELNMLHRFLGTTDQTCTSITSLTVQNVANRKSL